MSSGGETVHENSIYNSFDSLLSCRYRPNRRILVEPSAPLFLSLTTPGTTLPLWPRRICWLEEPRMRIPRLRESDRRRSSDPHRSRFARRRRAYRKDRVATKKAEVVFLKGRALRSISVIRPRPGAHPSTRWWRKSVVLSFRAPWGTPGLVGHAQNDSPFDRIPQIESRFQR